MSTRQKLNIFVLVLFVLAFLILLSNVGDRNQPDIRNKDPDPNMNPIIAVIDPNIVPIDDAVFELTGWTYDQLEKWASRKDVWPIKKHVRMKQYWDNKPQEMGPNEKYVYVITYNANDVAWAPKYWEECYCELPPYEDLPEAVRKILDRFDQNDIGKTIGDVVPGFAKPVLLCYFRNKEFAGCKPIAASLLSLSDDELKFRVAYEPFSPTWVKGIKADDRIVFHTEMDPNDRIDIGIRPRSKRFLKSLKGGISYKK